MCSVKKCSENHCTGAIEDSLLSKLQEMLPDQPPTYIMCSCERNGGDFKAVLRCSISTPNDAAQWKKDFESKSLTTWRILKSFPNVGERVLFKGIYRCHHKTIPHSSTADGCRGSKNTNCKAELRITVGRSVIDRTDCSGATQLSRSKDPHRLMFPMEIVINHCHNHQINAASALKHRDVAEDTKAKIDQLLLDGYAPSAALEKINLMHSSMIQTITLQQVEIVVFAQI